jgi:dTDP-4-amino-4,6-dideoxygalactose transaminase
LSEVSKIPLTQPLLPDLEELTEKLREIWDSKQLSNNGAMVQQLEQRLSRFLKADHLSVFSNGTTALQIACRVLGLTGEVITTPFTFPATVHALAWNQATPVFCDIEEHTFQMNADLIESLITEKTTAILPVHVFGTPCQVEKIQHIADQYHLNVLYDGAHTFGVSRNGMPIASFGDCTMFSFHATKIFNTIEGGALAFRDPAMKQRADEMRNFGLQTNGDILEPGINGKMNEVQAAVGLLLLDQVEEEIQKRKTAVYTYRELLSKVPGITLLPTAEGVTYNYPYFVIRVDEAQYGLSRDALFDRLGEHHITARKYFYPLCSNLSCYRSLGSADPNALPVANRVADSVLALPLYGNLLKEEIEAICRVIRDR